MAKTHFISEWKTVSDQLYPLVWIKGSSLVLHLHGEPWFSVQKLYHGTGNHLKDDLPEYGFTNIAAHSQTLLAFRTATPASIFKRPFLEQHQSWHTTWYELSHSLGLLPGKRFQVENSQLHGAKSTLTRLIPLIVKAAEGTAWQGWVAVLPSDYFLCGVDWDGFNLTLDVLKNHTQNWKSLSKWHKSTRQRKAHAFPSGLSGSPWANACWRGCNVVALL